MQLADSRVGRGLRLGAEAVKAQTTVYSDYYARTSLSMPYIAQIEPTLRCPMACKFCDLPTDRTYTKPSELPIERWMEILHELQEVSPLLRSVYISGGEPFLRRDLIRLIEYGNSIGMGMRTLTIGRFCDEPLLDRLLASPMQILKFSLHSSRADVHDELVGSAVFEKAVGAIRYLRKNGYQGKLGMLCTAFAGNADHLDEIARFGTDIGLDEIYFRPLFGQTVAFRDPEIVESQPRFAEDCVIHDTVPLRRSIEALKELRRSGAPIVDDEAQLDAIVSITEGTFNGIERCKMMFEAIYVKPNGDVHACGHLALGVLGNVAHERVRDVLSSPEAKAVRCGISRDCRCQGNLFVRPQTGRRAHLLLNLMKGEPSSSTEVESD
jgi:MoaA/NifB/PqqE/SkfB family radical SAM enzyme